MVRDRKRSAGDSGPAGNYGLRGRPRLALEDRLDRRWGRGGSDWHVEGSLLARLRMSNEK